MSGVTGGEGQAWDGIPSDADRPQPVVSNEVWAGVLRGGPQHFRFGDPWVWFAPYRSRHGKPGVAEIGCATPENTAAFEEIRLALAALGFQHCGWEKEDKQGRMVWRQFDCLTGRPSGREVMEG